jgi:hypothetical protein
MYFSDDGPRSGPFLRRDVKGRIVGVMESKVRGAVIGTARPCGWDKEAAQLWKLTVHGAEVPGRWVVVDREFRPAQEQGHAPR